MSGGSYDYLYAKDLVDLYGSVEEMAQRLSQLAERDSPAARDTWTILGLMDAIRSMQGRLEGVWHAVEWYDSCDYSRDQVDEAVKKYEEGTRR
ncbi:hypothetical protein [Streptomyces hoynatensis]|uniref:Uncharacterized protein n=1 Tax=Streptomyces hoynatensis TaxID=1141874 RepID=A0A3A9YFQ9_9ACTN|nr:hypothetical protein [Streptomyces hoynatensis]RKN35970.1 hypothetical protein D7294_30535 [Streptomyces hoynatensis]